MSNKLTTVMTIGFMFLFSLFSPFLLADDNGFVLESNDPPQIEWGPLENGSAVSIAVNKMSFAPGEKIDLQIRSKNETTNQKYYRYNRRSVFGYASVSVQTPQGVPAPLTSKGQHYELSAANSSFTLDYIDKEKAHVLRSLEPINYVFDMTLDGKYIIKAESCLRGNIDSHLVSNSLCIDISGDNLKRPEKISIDKKQWHVTDNSNVAIALVTDKNHYEDYGPVFLQISMRNDSKSTFLIPDSSSNIFDVYELVLFSPGQGRDYSRLSKNQTEKSDMTLYGQNLFSSKTEHKKYSSHVSQNEISYSKVLVLNRIFDMSTDGIYGLSVTGRIKDDSGKEQAIISKTIPIRIGGSLTQSEIEQRKKEQAEEAKKHLQGNK